MKELNRVAYEALGRLIEGDDDNICGADIYNIAVFCRAYLDILLLHDDVIDTSKLTDENLRKASIMVSEMARYGEAKELESDVNENN